MAPIVRACCSGLNLQDWLIKSVITWLFVCVVSERERERECVRVFKLLRGVFVLFWVDECHRY